MPIMTEPLLARRPKTVRDASVLANFRGKCCAARQLPATLFPKNGRAEHRKKGSGLRQQDSPYIFATTTELIRVHRQLPPRTRSRKEVDSTITLVIFPISP